ncbi:MAG: TatD family hydrolase [Clostridia bacterium]|nr:TatD family hydrolase [Clostridia bacterium]
MDIIEVLNPAPSGSIIDTHAHYDDERFDGFRNELLSQMGDMGVCKIINCAVDTASSKRVLDIRKQFPFCYCAVGFHPENLPDSEPVLDEIREIAKRDGVVAIGEIGLDYYWDKSKTELQKRWFCAQLELAKELSLPVIIHDREAHGDTLDILKEHKPVGVLHCYSGSVETAREILKLGMYIGVGGVATFKNARVLREVIAEVPLERMLLETDAPYLSPEPYRGKTCHSGMIIRVAEKISEIKNVSVDEVLSITRRNAEILFGI